MTVLAGYSHIGFTCFLQNQADVREAVRQQLSRWGLHVSESEGRVDLAQIYSVAPRPGGRHTMKAMFFRPMMTPGSTVMFANYADGWQSLAVCISKLLSGHAYCFAISNGDEWPLYRFEQLHAGDTVRHVSVIKDVDRWNFWQTGEPLPEEDVTVYQRRRIKDRLTREYLIALAQRLGFPIDDDRFWQSDSKAVYFEEQRAERHEPPS